MGEGILMEKVFFERCVRLAESLQNTQNNLFIRGYIRGMRRAFHGKDFGETEHEKYINMPEDEPDISRRLAGQGYRAGYAGIDIINLQTCNRCGWEFIPTRVKRDDIGKIIEILLPKTCPNPACNSPYWNKPRLVRGIS